ncbi:MAG: hypothetical protein NWE94_05220 [Candidatus Bathyarchaeota archaeon]|nr:hypothetical protein [Candidatus Bathyarchaeota archaeon]
MRLTVSTRVLVIVCVFALLFSAFNTYLIVDNVRLLNDKLSTLRRDYSSDDSIYGYVVFRDGDVYKAKNQTSGSVDFASTAASMVISQAIAKGTLVYIKSGNYPLTADINVINKANARIVSDGATIIGNGRKLTIRGDSYAESQNNHVSGLTFVNCTLRVENSFGTTIADMSFINCSTAIEFVNTETWSEGNKIENCRFVNSAEGIAFRTPTGNATGSYASTEISRCFFNLVDDSVGIKVERDAECSDSQLLNCRFWMGETGQSNQIGLLVEGTMFQTLISGVVFESFASEPVNLYAIVLGASAVTPPTFDGGVSFLGNWTARIHNPSGKWISGLGSVFRRENVKIPLGVSSQYGDVESIHARPLTISSFKPRIRVQGSFASGETVTVRFRLELLDNVIAGNVEKTFTNSSSLWLSDDDLLRLFPSQNVIWAILVDAKSSASSTDAVVQIDIYGTAT